MKWISTPAHGYLRVKRENMQGFKPSAYSRNNTKFCYLEEDCDAPEYLQHIWGDTWKANYVKERNLNTFATNDDIDTVVIQEN